MHSVKGGERDADNTRELWRLFFRLFDVSHQFLFAGKAAEVETDCRFRPESEPEFRSGLYRVASCGVGFRRGQWEPGEGFEEGFANSIHGMGRPVDWHRSFVAGYSGL